MQNFYSPLVFVEDGKMYNINLKEKNIHIGNYIQITGHYKHTFLEDVKTNFVSHT